KWRDFCAKAERASNKNKEAAETLRSMDSSFRLSWEMTAERPTGGLSGYRQVKPWKKLVITRKLYSSFRTGKTMFLFIRRSFRLRDKLRCLHLSRAFHLHKDAIFACLGKAVGERDLSSAGVMAHARHSRIRAATFSQTHRRHGNRTCRMDVSENVPIAADEHRMAGHAHIRFKIDCRPAIFVFYAKVEPVRPIGLELWDHGSLSRGTRRKVALPHHAIAAGKLCGGLCGRQISRAGIVAAQGAAGERRNSERRHLRFRKAGVVNDIGIELVPAL